MFTLCMVKQIFFTDKMATYFTPQYFDDWTLAVPDPIDEWENQTFYSDSSIRDENKEAQLSNTTCFLIGFLVGALIFMDK